MPLPNHIKIFIESQKKIKEAASLINDVNYESAQKFVIDALRMCPVSANAIYLYSFCQKQRGENEKAQQLKKQAYQLNPCFYATMGDDVQRVAKQISSNFSDMKNYVKKRTQEYEIKWAELASLYAKKKDLDTSLQVMRLFELVKIPDQKYTTHLHSTFGITYYEMGLYETSLEKYRVAIEIGNDQFRYMNNSAILTYIFGDYERSEQFARQSLMIKPNYAKTLFIQSFNLAKLGRIEQSMRKIISATEDSPKLILYRLKILTNFILYQPDKQKQLKQQLKRIIKIMNDGDDSDNYFNNNDNRPLLNEALKFIQRYIDHFLVSDSKDWRSYIQLLDDYLMKGHVDKYRITKQMRAIKQKMQSELKTVMQQVNENHLPDQVLELLTNKATASTQAQ